MNDLLDTVYESDFEIHFLHIVTRAALVLVGGVAVVLLLLAATTFQDDGLAVDVVLAAVVTDRGVETRLAVVVQQYRLALVVEFIEVEILRIGVDVHRQTVLREIDLRGGQRGNEVSAETVRAVRRIAYARRHVLGVVADVALVVVRE